MSLEISIVARLIYKISRDISNITIYFAKCQLFIFIQCVLPPFSNDLVISGPLNFICYK